MASLYRRGKSKAWCLSYFLGGRRVVKSLKTTDEKVARLKQKEIEVRLKRGIHQDSQRMDVAAYLAEYLQDTTHRKRQTNKNELYLIKYFLRECKKQTINGINMGDIRSFLGGYESKAPQTFNNALGCLKRFLKPAVRKGYILSNPTEGIKRKKLSQSLPRFFSDEEYQRIEDLAAAHPLYPMIVTARYTGLRLQELIHLEWEDFDWEKKLVRVVNKPQFNHTVKNRQARVVPISEELRDKLLPYIKAKGLCFPVPKTGMMYSEEGPKQTMRRIFKKAGLEREKRSGFHDFRHTFASRLVQNNVPIYKVSKWLGHSSLAVTQIYAHFAPIYDEDIEKLSMITKVLDPA